jgi:hypothetical protein
MHTYHVHYPKTYERSRRRAPLHCFSTLSRSMLICLAPRDLYSPADLIGPQHSMPVAEASGRIMQQRDVDDASDGPGGAGMGIIPRLWLILNTSSVPDI